MQINSKVFSDSFFYIGSGFDIQPLLRFSNLCDTFLYANLYLNQSEVESWYDEALENQNDIEVVSKKTFPGYDARKTLEQQGGKYTDVMSAYHMGHFEFMNYFMTFKDAKRQNSYLIVWKLRRKSSNRNLTLCFFTWEGLEAYANLSQNGTYAPRVLCTIETGILESPNGLINRFFLDENRAQPVIWIRGFEPTFNSFVRLERRDVLDPVGVFSVPGMAFNHQWSCGHSYLGQTTNKRYCGGFFTEKTAKILKESNWNPKFQTESHKFTSEGIQKSIPSMGERDIVICSRRLVDRHSCGGNQFYAWETILGNNENYLPVTKQIDNLKIFLQKSDVLKDSIIHIIPWCLEDENELYFEAVSKIDFKTITYCPNLADMLELKNVPFLDIKAEIDWKETVLENPVQGVAQGAVENTNILNIDGHIRPVNQGDFDVITSLAEYFQEFGDYVSIFQAMVEGKMTVLNRFNVINQPCLYVYDEKEGGQSLGFVAVEWSNETGNIHGVAVFNRYRKNGIASKLFNHVVEVAKSRNIRVLETITAENENPAALNFFKAKGFQISGYAGQYPYGQGAISLTLNIPDNIQTIIDHSIIGQIEIVNVLSKDDGTKFYDTSRLDAIENALRTVESPWVLHSSGPLSRVYCRLGSEKKAKTVLVSSHADSNYDSHFHLKIEESHELLGTFDNSITNALVLKMMLDDRLHPDVLVAFTGDEEEESRGAVEVISRLENMGQFPKTVIVLDVTDNRHYGKPFTIENYFANGYVLPRTESGFLKLLLNAFENPPPVIHHDEAYPDESWVYEEENVHVVSFCVPTFPKNSGSLNLEDWMHNHNGIRVRFDLFEGYMDGLSILVKHLMESKECRND